MKYRIAKKILTCKSSLHTNNYSVFKAKQSCVRLNKGYFVESNSGHTYFILR